MAWFFQKLFNEAFAATKSCNRFTSCRFEQLGNFLFFVGNLDTAATATECRFDGDWQTMQLYEI